MSACHSIMSVCILIMSRCHSITVSSCLLDAQLGSILSFNYYFLSLNYPWSFSHWIITVCHAISYLMNFIELWLVAIQLVNIVSISIDRLYLSPQKHPLITDWRLRAGSFALFLHEVWKWRRRKFNMWTILTEKEKIINELKHYWTKRWISMHVFLSFN